MKKTNYLNAYKHKHIYTFIQIQACVNRCSCEFITCKHTVTSEHSSAQLSLCIIQIQTVRVTAVSIFMHFAGPGMMKEGRDSQGGELNQEIVRLNCEENI